MSNSCIVCLKIGEKYSAKYVNILYSMIRKQTDLPFICFTDDAKDINEEVIIFPINKYDCKNYWPAWNKIELFGREELDKYDKKIFFDLDVIIHGSISKVLEHDENFSLIFSKWKKRLLFGTEYNSSCMVWKDNKEIYNNWLKQKEKNIAEHRGIDNYFYANKIKPTFLPDIFYSYTRGSKPDEYYNFDEKDLIHPKPVWKMLNDHSVAIFNGPPKMEYFDEDEHEIMKHWK